MTNEIHIKYIENVVGEDDQPLNLSSTPEKNDLLKRYTPIAKNEKIISPCEALPSQRSDKS